MKPVTRRLFFAELLERALDTGMSLAGQRFRTIEELEALPLATVLGIIPARNPQCALVETAGALWQVSGDEEPPQQVIELSAVAEKILAACDSSRRLAELVTDPESNAACEEEIRATFITLVRAGVVIPAEIPA